MRKIFFGLTIVCSLMILFSIPSLSYGTTIPDEIYDCHGTQEPHNLEYSFDLQKPMRPFKASAILFEICIDKEQQNMDVFVSSMYYRDGTMTIKIPREELNPLTPSCDDDVFQIKRSGKFTPYEETKTVDYREITFPIMTNDWQITIFAENPENTKLCDKTITKTQTYTLEDALETQRQRTGMDESIPIPDSNYPRELTAEDVKCMEKMGNSMSVEKNMAPKWQVICYNFPIDEVRCNDRLQLIFKSSNNSPVCVTPETAEKLMERGWANTS